jgi:4-amino-4-deoxy-L-arabinose transferase-like glycosyltransferase
MKTSVKIFNQKLIALFRKKIFIIPLLFLLLFIFSIVFYSFLSRMNFCGDISIHFNFKKQSNSLQLFAITPTGRKVDFVKQNENTYFIRGYYRSLNLSGTNKHFIDSITTVSININNHVNNMDRLDFLKYWDRDYVNENSNVYSLKSQITSFSFFYKIISFFYYTDNSFIFFILLGLFFILLNVLHNKFERMLNILHDKFKSQRIKIPRVTNKKVFMICIVLLLLYAIIFSMFVNFNDTVEVSGDYTVYQTEAVNFVKGNKLNGQTLSEKYKYNTSNIDSALYYEGVRNFQNIDIKWVPPAYPVFLSIIYKIFGVSPLIARYFQLLLLLTVASFLPLLLFFLWGKRGFIMGFISGLLFIIKYYNLANEIMTEPLMLFFCFLLLCSVVFFEKRNSNFSAIVLGVIIAIALLVKGVIVFFILLYLGSLIYRYLKNKDKLYFRKIIVVVITFFISLTPWLVYSNINGGIIQRLNVSKTELLDDKNHVNNIITVLSNSKTANQIDSSISIFNNSKFKLTEITIYINNAINIIKGSNTGEPNKRAEMISKLNFVNQYIDELIDKPCFKWNDSNYLYVKNLSNLVIISTNHTQNILESNNGKFTDGNWHRNDSIKYTYDKNINSPSILRVLNFYLSNPRFIPVIFPNKLYSGYHNFPFFLILIALIILDFIWLFIRERKQVYNRVSKIILLLLVPVILFFENYNIGGFTIFFALAVILIFVSMIQRKKIFLFSFPLSFNLLILNFILITLIFFGCERFTSIIDFLIITISVCYFFEYYSCVLGFGSFFNLKNRIDIMSSRL